MNNTMICIAIITKPHGIMGEAKLVSYTNKLEDIFGYSHLFDENKNQYKIIKRAENSGVFIVRISKASVDSEDKKYIKITSRNEIETLAGQKLYITKEMLSPTKEGEFYFEDLRDIEVKDQNKNLYGHIVEVRNFGAGDILVVKRPDHKDDVFLPFIQEFIIEINTEKKYLIFDFLTAGL